MEFFLKSMEANVAAQPKSVTLWLIKVNVKLLFKIFTSFLQCIIYALNFFNTYPELDVNKDKVL